MARPLSCLLVTIQTEAGLVKKVVDDNPFTIGRSLEAAIAFSDANISRSHILVRVKAGKVLIEDQGSANGTYVNGTRIDAHKAMPVEPKDVVRLGNSKIELTFTVLEKSFAQREVEESDLPPQEREAMIALVHGAHAEAQRLIKLGKEIHDNIIKTAEDRARQAEQKMASEREMILARAREMAAQSMEQARNAATQIVLSAEEDAKKAVAAIHQRAAEVRDQAEEYRHQQVNAAQAQADEVIRQSDQICQEMLDDAKARIREITEAAKIEGKEILLKAKTEAEATLAAATNEVERMKDDARGEIEALRALAVKDVERSKEQARLEAEALLATAQATAEKKAQEILAEAHSQALAKSEEFLKRARDQAQIERDELISKAEEELRETRHEKKKLEGDMALNLKKMRGELDQINSEIANQSKLLAQKRKVFDDEMAFLRELKEREANSLVEERRKEIEIIAEQRLQEIDRLKALKEEEAEVFVQTKKLEFEKLKNQYETQIANLKVTVADLLSQTERQNTELTRLNQEILEANNKLALLRPENDRLTAEIDSARIAKAKIFGEIKDLEVQQGHMMLSKQSLEQNLQALRQEYDAKVAEQKSVIDAELARLRKQQEDQLNQLRLEEMDRIKNARGEMIEELIKDREKIAREIFNQVELEIIKFAKSSDWVAASPLIHAKIMSALEEKSITMVTTQQSDAAVASVAVAKRRKAERFAWSLQGIALGFALVFGGQIAWQHYQADLNPLKTAAIERAKEIAADLERRKFNPPQDDELRDTYAGSVVYTKDFVQNYLDADFQEKWLKECTAYLLRKWRIEEDKTIDVLSQVNTLVNTLAERKEAIHPDYIQDGLKKMDALEAETVTKIKKILGGEVRFEAFRRFEKRFYVQYFQARLPAGNEDESPPAGEVE